MGAGGGMGAGGTGGGAGADGGTGRAGTLPGGEYVPRGIVMPDAWGGEKRSSPRTKTWSWGGAGTGIWIPHLLQKSLVADS